MNCTVSSRRPHRLWQELGIDRDLVADFFIVFARFEYALKRADYLICDKGSALPDWVDFAKKNSGKFDLENSEVLEAMNYLLANPPKRQVVQDGDLFFSDTKRYGNAKNSDFEKLIDIIKGVRNNLFHGGKFPSGPADEPGRDTQLIQSAICLLERALEIDEGVQKAFSG